MFLLSADGIKSAIAVEGVQLLNVRISESIDDFCDIEDMVACGNAVNKSAFKNDAAALYGRRRNSLGGTELNAELFRLVHGLSGTCAAFEGRFFQGLANDIEGELTVLFHQGMAEAL